VGVDWGEFVRGVWWYNDEGEVEGEGN
jgi:hypothetical protein